MHRNWRRHYLTDTTECTNWRYSVLFQVYSSQDVRTVLPNDANIFATIGRDFKLLMRATEKNPNVLQCCQRRSTYSGPFWVVVFYRITILDFQWTQGVVVTLQDTTSAPFNYFFLDITNILENMNSTLNMCRKSLLIHLERRRQIFPRFYFLSMQDVLHIICNG